ncbi:hypothetical protein TanjilG_07061 [Lupinus angustifolius]|uniref:Uncharacterized protein n=1 Tax=Lupinus angustifolius TaxID=3871 RepID=A0A4P1QY60_LUPAN|nr:hypothetical protein TanjilG_07061 [Lupinus angustifolius]
MENTLLPFFPLPFPQLKRPTTVLTFTAALPITITVQASNSDIPVTFIVKTNSVSVTNIINAIEPTPQYKLPDDFLGLLLPIGRLTLPTRIIITTNTMLITIHVSMNGIISVNPIAQNSNVATLSLFPQGMNITNPVTLPFTLTILLSTNITIAIKIRFFLDNTIIITSHSFAGTDNYAAFLSPVYSEEHL